jgi:hypothetical protein
MTLLVGEIDHPRKRHSGFIGRATSLSLPPTSAMLRYIYQFFLTLFISYWSVFQRFLLHFIKDVDKLNSLTEGRRKLRLEPIFASASPFFSDLSYFLNNLLVKFTKIQIKSITHFSCTYCFFTRSLFSRLHWTGSTPSSFHALSEGKSKRTWKTAKIKLISTKKVSIMIS